MIKKSQLICNENQLTWFLCGNTFYWKEDTNTIYLHQFLFKILFKVMQIYLKKDMSQIACVYFFYFVTEGREKLILGAGSVKR